MTDSDEVLVTKAQVGDLRSFGALHEKYRQQIESYCRRLLNSSQESEDAAQETFTQAWSKIGTLRSGNHFLPWVKRIATNICLNKKRGKTVEVFTVEDEILATIGNTQGKSDPDIERMDTFLYAEDILRRIEARASQVIPPWTPQIWTVFLLFYQEGLNATEIGTRLNIKPPTVRWMKAHYIEPLLEAIRQEINQENATEF